MQSTVHTYNPIFTWIRMIGYKWHVNMRITIFGTCSRSQHDLDLWYNSHGRGPPRFRKESRQVLWEIRLADARLLAPNSRHDVRLDFALRWGGPPQWVVITENMAEYNRVATNMRDKPWRQARADIPGSPTPAWLHRVSPIQIALTSCVSSFKLYILQWSSPVQASQPESYRLNGSHYPVEVADASCRSGPTPTS